MTSDVLAEAMKEAKAKVCQEKAKRAKRAKRAKVADEIEEVKESGPDTKVENVEKAPVWIVNKIDNKRAALKNYIFRLSRRNTLQKDLNVKDK